MSIPNLPTDNLYKFAALCGLVMVVAAQWYAWTDAEKQLEKFNANTVGLDVAGIEVENAGDRFSDEVKRLAEKVEVLKSDFDKVRTGEKEHSDIDWDSLDFDSGGVENYSRSMSKYARLMESQLQIIDRAHAIDRGRKRMVYGGIVLMVLGFGLWYYKCQRHLDKIVLNQARGDKA